MRFLNPAARNLSARRLGGLAVAGVLLAAALATNASAYVVVTIDNQVYEVASKPEVRGEMVYFTLNGVPVSLRVYEVNVAKTNEFNYLVDRGGDMAQIVERAKSLRPAQPTDDRIIVSSLAHQDAQSHAAKRSPEVKQAKVKSGPAYSFSGESSASKQQESEFAGEAREALAEAKRKVKQEQQPAAEPAARKSGRADADRVADLDAEIAAEQEYLRKLTGGEVTVDDLDREISKSMDKISRLQGKRAKAAGGEAAEPASSRAAEPEAEYTPSGTYPAGSRGAHLEAELQRAQEKLSRLKAQQASVPADAGDEREVSDELIGETQYRIDKLKKKLAKLGSSGE